LFRLRRNGRRSTPPCSDNLQREYGWQVEADWLVWLPGLVCGLNVACRAVDGDVLTATPVYPPFLSAPRLSGRQLSTAALCQATAAGAGILPR
jgi:bifunctional pyridoxal-dependent enzyme with beta-cystathionase and maltose regulon repressor activities